MPFFCVVVKDHEKCEQDNPGCFRTFLVRLPLQINLGVYHEHKAVRGDISSKTRQIYSLKVFTKAESECVHLENMPLRVLWCSGF